MGEEVRAFLASQVGIGSLHDVVLHGPAARSRPVSDERAAPTRIAELLHAGIADGAFAPVDVERTAVLIFEVLHGAADHVAAGADAERTTAAALHLVRSELQPAAAPHARRRRRAPKSGRARAGCQARMFHGVRRRPRGQGHGARHRDADL